MSLRSHLPHFRACLLVCFFALVCFSAGAQDASTGAIRGAVSDASGGRIPGAEVTVINTATDIRYSVLTDNGGAYAFELLPPGEYSIRAESVGMAAEVRTGLRVEVGGVLQIQFRLAVAGAHEIVTVSEPPPMVEIETSTVSSVIDERAIADLPLNGRRFSDLALLTPGANQDPRGLTSSSNGDLAFGGIRGFHSSYLVDGADNNNGFFAQARGRYRAPYQFSNEVVQEFRVSSNTYGAELGRAGGAVINVVTKSGSNRMHGGMFGYLRDSRFNARDPFLDYKPTDRQQQLGFTMGGPLRRNRAFFYGGFDQHILHVPIVVRFLGGSSTVVPRPGNYPVVPPDYEAADQNLVFAAASQVSSLGGEYRSEQIGNVGFFKVDASLTPHHYLSARVNTSRYYGQNNVFFDPASPITSFAISDNGEEDVLTETGTVSLTSALSSHTTSHLRLQFSRDLQQSFSNSFTVLKRIYGITDGFGRSTILPRRTRENKIHAAETLSLEGHRQTWKFGADLLLSRVYNYFPALFGGEYIFDHIKVNPFTFQPMLAGTELTPLRAFAHEVPRYYLQNFGSAESHPDSYEYAGFAQDNVRVTQHLSLNLGIRYDLQLFSTQGLVLNSLWPGSGRVPQDTDNFAPRLGFAYSVGNDHPLVIRGGYGLFYTRIPQIYVSTIATDNGLNSAHLFLRNADFYDHQVFPSYPDPLVNCPSGVTQCLPPADFAGKLTSDISAFSSNFQTPKVQQASLTIEREIMDRLAICASYIYVHGEGLIRARDVNLPRPVSFVYPVFDSSGTNLLGYYNVDWFATWQFVRSLTCPFPPCINPLQRPIPQLGAINVFESAASSIYHGLTVSVTAPHDPWPLLPPCLHLGPRY